jgi:uncharacterized membrane protein YeaQ/YmgE (transglycosylase-associated protein family)
MLNFLWWFAAGPLVGWGLGRLMRSGHNPWLDALAGLVGAILAGTVCALTGLADSTAPLEALVIAVAGALVVTFCFHKAVGGKIAASAKRSGSRSYTSYKSRMGK